MTGVNDALGRVVQTVEDVPDEFRKIAFAVLLWYELDALRSSDEGGTQRGSLSGVEAGESIGRADMVKLDPEKIEPESRLQQAIWAVWELTRRDQPATVAAVRKIIKDEFGVSPEQPTNLSNRLKKLLPKYMTRREENRRYIYTPTSHTLELLGDVAQCSQA